MSQLTLEQAIATPAGDLAAHSSEVLFQLKNEAADQLDAIEEPHLGRLMEKIAGPAKPASERLAFARPISASTAGTPAIPESIATQEI